MKLALFTTITTHHLYFSQQLNDKFEITKIFLEQKQLQPAFTITHEYLSKQEKFETLHFFDGNPPSFEDITNISYCETVNDDSVINELVEEKFDLVLVFGTGKVGEHIIELFTGTIFNLHGGDPENYRGLDSHLWAIYHEDFGELITCIHRISPQLDDGEIVEKTTIPLTPNMPLYQLRSANTHAAVELSLNLLTGFSNSTLVSFPQTEKAGITPLCLQF